METDHQIYIKMIGIDHSIAAVALREKFSFTKAGLEEALPVFRALDSVCGCVILSTCNRLEIYISTDGSCDVDLLRVLCQIKGVEPEDFRDVFITRSGALAAKHLFSLAAGMESRIIGEDQILMQVKTAIAQSRQAQCSDVVMEVLFRMAVTSGKKVKTEIPFSHANSSAVSAALDTLQGNGVCFKQMRCLVIGNGEMGRLTASTLSSFGADVTVTVRQYRSGEVQIPRGCRCIPYSERYNCIPACSLIVSATSSPNLTLTLNEIKKLDLPSSVIFMDLAVPRDIDPQIASLPSVQLYDIDSFCVSHQSEEVHQQMLSAQELITEDLSQFISWYACRDVIPVIRKISEAAAADLVWRCGPSIRKLTTSENRTALEEQITSSGVKVIQKLIFSLRDQIDANELRNCLTAMEAAYPIDDETGR